MTAILVPKRQWRRIGELILKAPVRMHDRSCPKRCAVCSWFANMADAIKQWEEVRYADEDRES